MPQLLVATRNLKKQRELDELLANLNWDVLSLRDFPGCPEAVEDGETFIENAAIKAKVASQHSGLIALADDSGLEVDALGGKPGVYSARYARGEGSTDEENLIQVLQELKDVPPEERTGRFVCAVVIAQGAEILFQTRATVEGVITKAPRGKGGFGYDPIFYYPPFGKTLAEVTPDEKHGVSHRGQALRQSVNFLKALQSKE